MWEVPGFKLLNYHTRSSNESKTVLIFYLAVGLSSRNKEEKLDDQSHHKHIDKYITSHATSQKIASHQTTPHNTIPHPHHNTSHHIPSHTTIPHRITSHRIVTYSKSLFLSIHGVKDPTQDELV